MVVCFTPQHSSECFHNLSKHACCLGNGVAPVCVWLDSVLGLSGGHCVRQTVFVVTLCAGLVHASVYSFRTCAAACLAVCGICMLPASTLMLRCMQHCSASEEGSWDVVRWLYACVRQPCRLWCPEPSSLLYLAAYWPWSSSNLACNMLWLHRGPSSGKCFSLAGGFIDTLCCCLSRAGQCPFVRLQKQHNVGRGGSSLLKLCTSLSLP